jgi:hypothetical protein
MDVMNSKKIDNSQNDNPRALQVTTHFGLAIQSKLMFEKCMLSYFISPSIVLWFGYARLGWVRLG